jgi:hypothetical protein
MKTESHNKLNDGFTLFPKERKVYKEILNETILNNKRCVQISLSKLKELTGLPETTIADQLKKLEKRKMITIDNTEKTQIICINIIYKEIYDV